MSANDIRLTRVVEFYESMTPQSLESIESIYSANAAFKDPFNDVQGTEAITAIFKHMYTQVESPRFQVRSRMADGNEAFLSWHFLFRMHGKEQCIEGATHLRFDSTGLIVEHRDHWDAAEELYEKLPVLGILMRWLKRRLAS
ncbi:MAG: nuclear transport factor 2 family protein [Burkholderiaceae bacterium]|nr:nuclear transport factor 2 family protein [Burkholderiaceae bacterium]